GVVATTQPGADPPAPGGPRWGAERARRCSARLHRVRVRARVGEAAGRAGRLPVCADGGAAVVPAGDAQAVAGAGVAGAPAGCGWHLAAGAEPGDGGGPRPGGLAARAVAALGAGDDHGAPREAGANSPP